MNLFYSIVKAIVYLPFKLFFPTKVINKINFPKKKKLITVSNHLSWSDIPVVAISLPGYRHFMAKKEIGNNRLIRKLAKWLGVIFVDRGKADMSAMRDTVNVLKKGESVTIFPEGTRNKEDNSLQEVKSGIVMFSVKGDAPIVPVMIYSGSKVFRKNYIYVAPPFELEEFKGRRLDSVAVAMGAEIVTEKMSRAKEMLDFYVANRKNKDFKLMLKQNKIAKKNSVRFAVKTVKAARKAEKCAK